MLKEYTIRMLLLFMAIGMVKQANAQRDINTSAPDVTVISDDLILVDRKFYSASGIDGAMFSTALMQSPLSNNSLSTLRFNMLSFGVSLHYDFSHTFGVFSGLGIKNIGFIEKVNSADSTIKRRVYTLGAPLAFKFGDLKTRNFVFAGGGVDLALNYREKGFVKRGDKEKFNEWFSDRTPSLMPYLLAGISFDPGLTLKLQYYPQNFLNEDFVDEVTGAKSYAGYKVNLLLLVFGIDLHYNTLPHEIVRKPNAP